MFKRLVVYSLFIALCAFSLAVLIGPWFGTMVGFPFQLIGTFSGIAILVVFGSWTFLNLIRWAESDDVRFFKKWAERDFIALPKPTPVGADPTVEAYARKLQTHFDELAHDRQRLTTILANMIEAVVAINKDGRIAEVNPAFSKLFGISSGEAQGRFFLEVLRHHHLNEMIRGVLEDSSPRTEEVTTFSPEERNFEAHALALQDKSNILGALLVLHDVTRLRQLERIRTDFVANVSHELRTPLSLVKGFAETLREGGIDDVKNRMGFIRSIEKQVDRMTELVNDLLDLSAIEAGRRPPRRELFALPDAIKEVLDGARVLAERKEIRMTSEISPDCPPLKADKAQIRQVLTNLVENAIKFNHHGGQITVKARLDGSWTVIDVQDTGVGIPAESISRIFERFYRVDKARSREMGGTGLGLAIVKHIIEAHGGRVECESTEGEGTTFRVRLPNHEPRPNVVHEEGQ